MLIDRDTDSSSQVYHRRFNSDPGSRRLSERRGHIFNVSPRHTPSPDSSTQTNCMFSHFFTGCSTSSTCSPPSSHGTTPSPNTSTLSLPLSTPRSSIDRLPHSLSFSGRAKALDIPHPFMLLLHCASSSSDIDAECNDFSISTATALPSDSLGSKHSRRPSTDFASLACSTYSYPLPDNDEDSDSDIGFSQTVLSVSRTSYHARSQGDDTAPNVMQQCYRHQIAKLEGTLGAGDRQEMVFGGRSASRAEDNGAFGGMVRNRSVDGSFGDVDGQVGKTFVKCA